MGDKYTSKVVFGLVIGAKNAGTRSSRKAQLQVAIFGASAIESLRKLGPHPDGKPMQPFVGFVVPGHHWGLYLVYLTDHSDLEIVSSQLQKLWLADDVEL